MHQRAILQALLCLVIPSGLMFGYLNFSRELYYLALSEVMCSVSALYFWGKVKTVKNPRLIVAFFTIPIFAIISSTIYRPDASVTMFAWVYTIPVLAYAAMGERLGFCISAFFFVSIGLQFQFRFENLQAFQEPAAVLNVVVCSLAIWGVVHAYERARVKSQALLSVLAKTDPLTGLNNRLGLDSIFERRKESSKGAGSTVGLIMVDLDHFKSINDTYGHGCGDEVLRQVAVSLKGSVRADDVVFRMGGEEFCLVLSQVDRAQLLRTAEVIRERVQSIEFSFIQKEVTVTCSLGGVLMDSEFEGLDELLVEADRRLYLAKETGRNRVVLDEALVAEVA